MSHEDIFIGMISLFLPRFLLVLTCPFIGRRDTYEIFAEPVDPNEVRA